MSPLAVCDDRSYPAHPVPSVCNAPVSPDRLHPPRPPARSGTETALPFHRVEMILPTARYVVEIQPAQAHRLEHRQRESLLHHFIIRARQAARPRAVSPGHASFPETRPHTRLFTGTAHAASPGIPGIPTPLPLTIARHPLADSAARRAGSHGLRNRFDEVRAEAIPVHPARAPWRKTSCRAMIFLVALRRGA